MPAPRRYWRIAGVLSVAGAAALAALFPGLLRGTPSLASVAAYGAVVVVLLGAAVYVAFLDIRFTRLQFRMGERVLFRETFMDPEFRRSLHLRQGKADDAAPDARDASEGGNTR